MPPPSKHRVQFSEINEKRLSTSHLKNQMGNISFEEEIDMDTNDLNDGEPSNFKEKLTVGDIADLFQFCKAQCPLKYLSVLFYMSLRRFGVNWNDCDCFLRVIRSLKAMTAYKRSKSRSNNDSYLKIF